ncbi:putative oxidoreductase C-terminal domain-containing protein [Flavisolibacter ginsenosidimutans]|uniref:Oxidoreductase n=1 Tax=Flavisolibacter ginsenosidimutans TaxID=661481 RepID=A0A5B8UI67_9BACT|nr:putative oxidoreductase C-terminal domain-containing protein [Flavisolibacter ginsenosidimutans]QEC56344.1 oxidoreductase [Flavisolibacter ginsenosidimutans]
MKKQIIIILSIVLSLTHSFAQKPVRLITLDPGHFHAALVQKSMYADVDPTVHVYAPAGPDLQAHLDRIKAYNSRSESPTKWKEVIYTGDNFFEKMLAEKKGNVVVLSGNNQKKAEYILKSLQGGFNVLADKPMAIDEKGFEQLKQAFAVADKKGLLLYDIMTERFEITSVLMRELAMMPDLFGTLQNGTAADPAVVKESVHYFYKYVSSSVLTRPQWFFDVSQQGNGIADVMTHIVDLAQWECFPDQAIDYTKDIQLLSARRSTTPLSLTQFKTLTKTDAFPDYLKNAITNDTLLNVYSNGEIHYRLRGVFVKTSVVWNYAAPEGSGDQYTAMMRGTKTTLFIKQGAEEGYKPTLFIQPFPTTRKADIEEAFKKLQTNYPGVELKKVANGWQVVIPDKYKEGHEEHFARVTQNFLSFLKNHNMPGWEVPNMLAKYYTTTKALSMAMKAKP